MNKNPKSALIAVSGGVDSAVAAYLLKKQGFKVEAVYFKLANCQSEKAFEVCQKLGIKLNIVDLQKEFKENIVKYFIDQYQLANTPNPCVVCNRLIKFKYLMKTAQKLDFHQIATGHYAKINNKNTLITLPKDEVKDQTYFLWNLKKSWLKKIIFPLADYQKTEVKKIALKQKLLIPSESQEICFINTNTKRFLESKIKARKGKIKNLKGEVIGEHCGLPFYTIGQRAGIDSFKNQKPDQKKMYVLKKDVKNHVLFVGTERELYNKDIKINNLNLFVSLSKIKKYSKESNLYAKIRYGQKKCQVQILKITSSDAILQFKNVQRAIAPGQSVVLYSKKALLGGGIIY